MSTPASPASVKGAARGAQGARLLGAALGAAIALGSSGVLASPGLAAGASALPPKERAALEREIEAARRADPAIFEAVYAVRGHRPEVYRRRRKPAPEVTPELRALGSRALLPMLRALAFEAPDVSGLEAAEVAALRRGMAHVAAERGDARALPVFRAIFAAPSSDPETARAAARGLGRICGDAELAELSASARKPSPRRVAAVIGLGECRRAKAAKELAAIVRLGPGEAFEEAVDALGRAASSWAWKARGPAAAATADAVRAVAAEALAAALPGAGPDARRRLGKALALAEHQGGAALVRAARGRAKDAEAARDIERLADRLERAEVRARSRRAP